MCRKVAGCDICSRYLSLSVIVFSLDSKKSSHTFNHQVDVDECFTRKGIKSVFVVGDSISFEVFMNLVSFASTSNFCLKGARGHSKAGMLHVEVPMIRGNMTFSFGQHPDWKANPELLNDTFLVDNAWIAWAAKGNKMDHFLREIDKKQRKNLDDYSMRTRPVRFKFLALLLFYIYIFCYALVCVSLIFCFSPPFLQAVKLFEKISGAHGIRFDGMTPGRMRQMSDAEARGYQERGFLVFDPWSMTMSRPDANWDGVHFLRTGNCEGGVSKETTMMILNQVCN